MKKRDDISDLKQESRPVKGKDYKKMNVQLPPIRVPIDFKDKLEKEADSIDYSLSEYIRFLIERGRKAIFKK